MKKETCFLEEKEALKKIAKKTMVNFEEIISLRNQLILITKEKIELFNNTFKENLCEMDKNAFENFHKDLVIMPKEEYEKLLEDWEDTTQIYQRKKDSVEKKLAEIENKQE